MFTENDRKLLGYTDEHVLRLDHDMSMQYASLKGEFLDIQRRIDNQMKATAEIATLKTKVELYEKFIAKMLESDSDKSNDVFMFDGEIYRLTDYHLYSEAGKVKTLTAEFDCMTGVTKNFKEK